MQVVTTVPDMEQGTALARSITEQRLAAGVQLVGPIRSFYWWKGALRDEEEWQLVIMTTTALLGELESHIKSQHSYETPQIVAMEIVQGSAEYLRWISDETQRTGA
ncbi:divalent-cation tolerance protein CutA [Nonomuraea sp. NPDC050310]|uniref:divalent-cation tolerance protein CutA n=1 Tax=Nonomuraea sp. NPDC050310 TaxID=3154935 RepID=UPI0033FDD8EB